MAQRPHRRRPRRARRAARGAHRRRLRHQGRRVSAAGVHGRPATLGLYSMQDIPASTGCSAAPPAGGGQAGDMTAAHCQEQAEGHEQSRASQADPDGHHAARGGHAARARARPEHAGLRGHPGDRLARHPRARPAEGAHAPRPRQVRALQRERPKDPEQAAGHVLRDFARSAAVAQNLVVVRCEIGTASTVARQIDNLNHSDVVGTLAGDDTFLDHRQRPRDGPRDAALHRPSPRGLARRHLFARTLAGQPHPSWGAAPAAASAAARRRAHPRRAFADAQSRSRSHLDKQGSIQLSKTIVLAYSGGLDTSALIP